ncbi:MAG: GNAT family N-acetyltransferase, partial [Butyricicoccus sp.]|nr:GNAT family N-acetyltransferase [Butyricicoccus sp.]
MRQNQELIIRFADEADTPAVIALWELCFPGEAAFQNYFFSQLYRPEYNLLLLREGTLCAMAQMLPYTLQNGSLTEEVTYIYGACTHPEYRRQHLMDRLLHQSFAIDRAQGRVASILIPQEEWLFGFYAQFGYQKAFSVSSLSIQESVSAPVLSVRKVQGTDFSAMDALYHRFLNSGPYLRRSEEEWAKQVALFRNTGGEALCAYEAGELTGYAFVWPTEEEVWAQELVCLPADTQSWVATLQQRYGRIACRVTGLQFPNLQPLGCMLRYDGAQPAEGYIN